MTIDSLTVKPIKTAKKKPRGKPFTGKGDPRNGNGAPKRGESWAELISAIGEMDGPQVAEFAGKLGREFNTLPQGVTLKSLAVIRIYGALLNDPQPGLLNAFMDRVEGKVRDVISGDGDHPIKQIIEVVYTDALAIAAPSSGTADNQE